MGRRARARQVWLGGSLLGIGCVLTVLLAGCSAAGEPSATGRSPISARTAQAPATAVFDHCIQDPLVEQSVWQDAEQGDRLGVSGTPAFVINGRLVQGAYSLEVFRAVIEDALARN